MILIPSERKTSSKLAMNLASWSRTRSLTGRARSTSTMLRLRDCWTTHTPAGFAVIPATSTRRVSSLIKKSTRDDLATPCRRRKVTRQHGGGLASEKLGPRGPGPGAAEKSSGGSELGILRLIAASRTWEIEGNSVGNGRGQGAVSRGQRGYVGSPLTLDSRQNWGLRADKTP